MEQPLNCFKRYDVRGKLGTEINEGIAYQIGRATAQFLNTQSVVVGFDARETSGQLAKAAAKGICDAGSDVFDIGLVGTEEMYWAVSELKADAGIEITASHNPIEYNGMKIVKSESQPLLDKEFLEIKLLAEKNKFSSCNKIGRIVDQKHEARAAYLKKIISFIDLESLKPLKL